MDILPLLERQTEVGGKDGLVSGGGCGELPKNKPMGGQR